MKSFDGVLFGNGMTCNLLNQLRNIIKQEYHYMMNIDDFIVAWINEKLSKDEDNFIMNIFYDSKNSDTVKYYNKMKSAIALYYKTHDRNIEYHLGADLFRKEREYDYNLIKSIFPFLYNAWHECLMNFLISNNLTDKIENFYTSVLCETGKPKYKFTTNFDLLAESIKPNHLHGSFVRPFRSRYDLVLQFINENQFDFKCIWGWNGIGKRDSILRFSENKSSKDYFDFGFFFDDFIKMNYLLVYGLGFKNSGYMEDLQKAFPLKYNHSSYGGIIDEHILIRIKEMQKQKLLKTPVFTYYTKEEKEHFEDVLRALNIQEYDLIETQQFHFNI